MDALLLQLFEFNEQKGPAVIRLHNGSLLGKEGAPGKARSPASPQPWRLLPPGLPFAGLESLDPSSFKVQSLYHYLNIQGEGVAFPSSERNPQKSCFLYSDRGRQRLPLQFARLRIQ
jgi:hypothetical protein